MKDVVKNAEKEQQIYDALCINYTAAYSCDLMTDYIELIKKKDFSHSARKNKDSHRKNSYSGWIQYAYDHIIIKETAPDYLEMFDRENLMKRLRKEKSFRYRHRTVPNGAGMEYFEIVVVKLYEDDHSFKVILGYQPIDDMIREELERQKQLEEILYAAEIANQSKMEFLSRMSHDIRTPLNGIIGLININENHFDDRELVKANHEKMKVAANHLLSLINDVLQMSKLEDGRMEMPREWISLIDLTQDIVAIVVDKATEAGIKWEFERGKANIPYPYIYGSSLHLRQVFLNIYGNCIKYNRAGGAINTIVEDMGCENGICTYRWIISDTGIGMSPEFVENIFEPFAQEKNDARSNYQGAVVTVAMDGRQALELFREKPEGTFDAILMDVMMPVMNGLDTTKSIRSLDRADAGRIPIIAMTVNAFEEDVRRCLDVGMNAHIAKPLDMEKVKQTIYDQIRKHEYS